MKAIDFVVRDGAGALQRGVVQADEPTTTINAASGQEISLNLRQVDMQGHARDGDALNIVLADGRVIIIDNYFNDNGEANRLFISADGYLNEVAFVDTSDGSLFAQYGPTEQWGKWSPSDDLIYLGRTDIADAALLAPAEDEVSQLLPLALLGGVGGVGAGAAVAAGVAAVGVAASGGGGGSVATAAVPTVDDPATTPEIGGPGDDLEVVVTGTGEPGDEVSVTVGDETGTATIDEDGIWEVVLTGDTFPEDGVHEAEVVVTHPDGSTTELDGPTFTIDTTPPEIAVTSGTTSTGEVFNGEELEGDVSISGTGEAGATLTVTSGSATQTTTVGEDGSWTVTWPAGTFEAGEYDADITIVATDSFGNASTTTDTVSIDTVSEVSVATATIAGDGTINAAEQAEGVTLTGTSQPGSTVNVTFEGTTLPAVVDANGGWSVQFPPSAIPTGEYVGTVTAVAVDANGNSATTTGTIQVDTVSNVDIASTTIGGDGIINGAEQTAGVTITGTAQPGSTLEVTFEGTSFSAVAGADGSWSVAIPSSAIPTGEYDATVTAVATDASGNSSSASSTVQVDTVSEVSVDTSAAGGDGTINGAEQAAGVTLTGSAQPGSTVNVTFGTSTLAATVDANGGWSVDFPASAIPTGEYEGTVTAVATDANGNVATTTGTVQVDTLVNTFEYTSTSGGADGVINASEAQAGLIVTGNAEPGSTVQVALGGVTTTATVAADGSWTATYSADQLAPGTYTSTLTATATDAAGNTSSIDQAVTVDTEAGLLTISSDPIETDDIINAAEAADGVVLSGTSDPGAIVQVTLGSVTRTVVANGNGDWQASYTAGEIPAGTYVSDITATTTDAAGNTRVVTDSVNVDTRVDNLSVSADIIETDNVISAAERSDGVVLTGTTEPGSTISVTVGTETVQAIVDANGNWTASFAASQIPTGELTTNVTVNATDAAGNTASVTDTVRIDTLVNTLEFSSNAIATDNVVNGAEAREGISLGGQVEAGSTVIVDFNGTLLAANVDAAGNWSIDIPPSAIPAGTYAAAISVTATDSVGNVDTITQTLSIDTEAPDGPVIASFTRDGDGIRGISTEIETDDLSVAQVNADGSVTDVAATQVDIGALGETNFQFSTNVPDGSQLIVTATDTSGNTSGTFVVLDDESANSTVDLGNPNLGNSQIEAVDLQFAEEALVTITEAQLVALSDETNTLTIHGGSDDNVNIAGATLTGQTQSDDGQTFDVYTLGEGTVLIDDDITVNTVIG
jgi:hypothetical protein